MWSPPCPVSFSSPEVPPPSWSVLSVPGGAPHSPGGFTLPPPILPSSCLLPCPAPTLLQQLEPCRCSPCASLVCSVALALPVCKPQSPPAGRGPTTTTTTTSCDMTRCSCCPLHPPPHSSSLSLLLFPSSGPRRRHRSNEAGSNKVKLSSSSVAFSRRGRPHAAPPPLGAPGPQVSTVGVVLPC